MIDHPRGYDQNMCNLYLPSTSPEHVRLDEFGVFKKGMPIIYSNYYTNAAIHESYPDPEYDTIGSVYTNLTATTQDYHRDDWKHKIISDWTEDDSLSWFIETIQLFGINEYDVPSHNFRISGMELKGLRREDIVARMMMPSVDSSASRRIGDMIYEKLQYRLNEESAVFRYGETDLYPHPDSMQTMLDLDTLDHKNRYPSDYRPNDSSLLQPPCDSDDAEEVFRGSDTGSPLYYGSDGSKSSDEDDKRKQRFKRPPGRPKGSGRKVCKRPRSVSVPEFLRNLLFDPKYCPAIIKWEDHSLGKFRFVKPDEVAKLWGQMKQNDNMTFEKFSRAMRYHYRQSVLVSVPTARLVYQFGHKGPDINTPNPNFVKVKTETDVPEVTYS